MCPNGTRERSARRRAATHNADVLCVSIWGLPCGQGCACTSLKSLAPIETRMGRDRAAGSMRSMKAGSAFDILQIAAFSPLASAQEHKNQAVRNHDFLPEANLDILAVTHLLIRGERPLKRQRVGEEPNQTDAVSSGKIQLKQQLARHGLNLEHQ